METYDTLAENHKAEFMDYGTVYQHAEQVGAIEKL